jgi:hypothetical protein
MHIFSHLHNDTHTYKKKHVNIHTQNLFGAPPPELVGVGILCRNVRTYGLRIDGITPGGAAEASQEVRFA